MISNKMISAINKLSGGTIKKTDLKNTKKKTITTTTAKTKLLVEDGVVKFHKVHKPSVATVHSKSNLYRTIRAVWDLTKALDVELAENDVKLHVDKYINSVRAKEEGVNTFVELVTLSNCNIYNRLLKTDVKVDYVMIGAKFVGDTVVPFIECSYIAELEMSNHED